MSVAIGQLSSNTTLSRVVVSCSSLQFFAVLFPHCPIFLLVVYEIKLGTVDQMDVDVEWKLRPYMNTARKRLALSTDN